LDCADLWLRVSKQLKALIKPQEYHTWIEPLKLEMETSQAVFLVPNLFFRDWLIEKYQPILDQVLSRELGREVPVVFALAPEGSFSPPVEVTPEKAPKPKSTLTARYSFDTFVVGPCNELAHAACLAVAEQPGKAYNPLFIFGGSGLGKTHLLNATGNHLSEKDPSLKVHYSSTEVFTNELILAIRFDGVPRFQEKYRRVDCLLLDDIQFISGRERTQEELFYTFNALFEAGKQIILTSDQKPRDIPGLEKRLCTRFEWGLLTDLQPPDLETKVAILQKKAAADKGLRLSREVAFFLASQPEANVRVLEGYLTRLKAASQLGKQSLSLDAAQKILSPLVGPKKVSLDEVFAVVTDHFGIKLSDLKGPRKNRAVSLPRQVAMYLARRLTRASFPDIGRALGGKDHSSIVKGVAKIKGLLADDPALAQALKSMEKAVMEKDTAGKAGE